MAHNKIQTSLCELLLTLANRSVMMTTMVIDLTTRQPMDSPTEFPSLNPSDNRTDGGVPSYLLNPTLDTLAESKISTENQPPLQDVSAGFSEILDSIAKPSLKAENEVANQYSAGQKWEPTELKPRHREMMRRVLEGATYIEIAEAMGISPQSVMLVCSSSIFKEELSKLDNELNLNIIRRAEELSNEAIDKLKVMMRRARAETLQVACAKEILGIAGYSKIEKKQVAVISGEDVIRELNRRRRDQAANVSATGNPRPNTRESVSIESAELVS